MKSQHPTLLAFEKEFIKPMRQWAIYVPAKELPLLDQHVRKLQQRSEAMSRQFFKDEVPDSLKTSWHGLLKELERLIPAVLGEVEKVKKEAWFKAQAVGKNQKTLKGYRRSANERRLLVDSEG